MLWESPYKSRRKPNYDASSHIASPRSFTSSPDTRKVAPKSPHKRGYGMSCSSMLRKRSFGDSMHSNMDEVLSSFIQEEDHEIGSQVSISLSILSHSEDLEDVSLIVKNNMTEHSVKMTIIEKLFNCFLLQVDSPFPGNIFIRLSTDEFTAYVINPLTECIASSDLKVTPLMDRLQNMDKKTWVNSMCFLTRLFRESKYCFTSNVVDTILQHNELVRTIKTSGRSQQPTVETSRCAIDRSVEQRSDLLFSPSGRSQQEPQTKRQAVKHVTMRGRGKYKSRNVEESTCFADVRDEVVPLLVPLFATERASAADDTQKLEAVAREEPSPAPPGVLLTEPVLTVSPVICSESPQAVYIVESSSEEDEDNDDDEDGRGADQDDNPAVLTGTLVARPDSPDIYIIESSSDDADDEDDNGEGLDVEYTDGHLAGSTGVPTLATVPSEPAEIAPRTLTPVNMASETSVVETPGFHSGVPSYNHRHSGSALLSPAQAVQTSLRRLDIRHTHMLALPTLPVPGGILREREVSKSRCSFGAHMRWL